MRHFKIISFLFLAFTYSAALHSQYAENIRSGRPGQAIGPYTVGSKIFQVQAGQTWSSFSAGYFEGNINTTSAVLRQGLTENLEVSGLISYRGTVAKESTNGNSASFDSAQLGLRYHLLNQKGVIPSIGIQGRVLIPLMENTPLSNPLGFIGVLATSNRINDKFGLTTNWKIARQTGSTKLTPSYIVNLSYSITDRLGTFAEVYGTLESFSAHFDTGLAFLISNDLQLDISAGYEGDSSFSLWFADAGFSWRWNQREVN